MNDDLQDHDSPRTLNIISSQLDILNNGLSISTENQATLIACFDKLQTTVYRIATAAERIADSSQRSAELMKYIATAGSNNVPNSVGDNDATNDYWTNGEDRDTRIVRIVDEYLRATGNRYDPQEISVHGIGNAMDYADAGSALGGPRLDLQSIHSVLQQILSQLERDRSL